ncbi:MAG: metallophosphoesterase family protein [Gammaproteobacteria bacterium]|nr:metallophosphoesterase family protein [Gammaproteobacteria bacterium]
MNPKFNEKFDLSHLNNLSIAVVSDTHTVLDDDVRKIVEACDIVIHAGDIGSLEVIESLKPKRGLAFGVAGNNDKPYLWDMPGWEFLKTLPDSIEITVPGGVIAVEHGHAHDMHKPSHDDLRAAHKDCRAVVYGHTHHQIIDNSHTNCWVLNPGAAGNVRTHGGPSCLKLNVSDENWDIESYRFTN